MDRVILHSDANCFYAGVEMLYHPEHRGKPLAVGGDREKRNGIILTANYIAKKCGVKTGMALWQAKEACPELVIIHPRMDLYLRFSGYMREIYEEYTDKVEPFGCDESWLDVTESVGIKGDGLKIAETLRRRIKTELGITVSVGVSFNKIFAKLGSDYKKPDAVTTVLRCEFREKVWRLPASDLLLIGRSTSKKLYGLGIETIGQVAQTPPEALVRHIGKMGELLWAFANGLDETEVARDTEESPVKSIGNSVTAPRDILNFEEAKIVLYVLAESVGSRLRKHGFRAGVIEIYVRDKSLNSFTRQRKQTFATDATIEIAREAASLFYESYHWHLPVRSLGVRAMDLKLPGYTEQLDLFTDDAYRKKLVVADRAVDEIRRHFGYFSIQRGVMLEDRTLSLLDAEGEHIVHPVGFVPKGK